MNILYFSLDDFDSLESYRSINTDLLREFVKHGHSVYVISPSERRKGFSNRVLIDNHSVIVKPKIGNIQKTNVIEKGISTITVGRIIIRSIKKYLCNVKIDLILYCTPPITFLSAIKYVKKRDMSKTYLLLKDIFPQNAIDLGMLETTGIKGIIYRYFRRQEKKLYALSDRIGCMSPANVKYVINHNPEVDSSIVEVCPNSIEVVDKSVDPVTRRQIRKKYVIPLDKKVFVYGGNLGKPQGIPFLIECIRKCRDLDEVFFLIVGDGTEYHLIEEFIETEHPQNIKLMNRIPKDDYDTMVGACDIGMIFLDYRFTIPNFPSRLLSYMAAKLPVLACTDVNTDIGKVISDNGFGWWCESNDAEHFKHLVDSTRKDSIREMGEKGFAVLISDFCVKISYDAIMSEDWRRKNELPSYKK